MSGSRVQIPVEVRAPAVVFDVVSRGYDRRQVNAHVTALEQTVAELRWEHDDLEAQGRELAGERAAFALERERWRPSFTELGEAAEQILSLADGEARALVAAARESARQLREDVDTETRAMRRGLAQETEQARQRTDAELAELEQAAGRRRAILDREVALARRDAELHATGLVAQARVQAEELVARARGEAEQRLASAQAHLAQVARDRDRLAAELVDLAGRLQTVVAHLSPPGPGTPAPGTPAPGTAGRAAVPQPAPSPERVTVSLLGIDD